MKTQTITSLLALSLATIVPKPASADLKDAIAGGVVGAIITEGIRRENQKAQQRQQQQRRVVSKPSKSAAPSLNSQYSRDERIRIQSSLRDLGYSVGVVDGVLGRNSRAAIRQFQASRGEPQTGQLTPSQYVALTNPGFQTAPTLANRPLNRDEVAMLQQGLQMLGYYRGYVDGSNGPGTRSASAAFLASMGTNPAMMTEVQTLVLARNNAGLPTPPYLQQEAANQMAAANGGAQFGVPGQTQQTMFGAPQQGQFGAAGQQQNLFAPPAGQQPAGTMAGAPANNLFGAPTTQQPAMQAPVQGSGQQNLFAPQGGQPAPQVAPQQPVPQGGQPNALFASTGGAATQPVAVAPQAQQPQSTLDIFSGSQPQQQAAPAQVATQQAPVAVPQGDAAGQPQMLFAAPAGSAPAPSAPAGSPAQTGSLDIFAVGSN